MNPQNTIITWTDNILGEVGLHMTFKILFLCIFTIYTVISLWRCWKADT